MSYEAIVSEVRAALKRDGVKFKVQKGRTVTAFLLNQRRGHHKLVMRVTSACRVTIVVDLHSFPDVHFPVHPDKFDRAPALLLELARLHLEAR